MASEEGRGDGDEGRPQIRPAEPMNCYSCGTLLPEGRRHCPACGRSLFRTCYCGSDIPVTSMTCPNCGADWSQSARVRRKKTHGHTIRTTQLAGYALAGAVVAALTASVIEMVITAMAYRSLEEGTIMPTSLFERLVLAAQTVLSGIAGTWGFLTAHATSLLGFFAVLLLGAAAGTIYYITTVRHSRSDTRDRNRSRSRENRVRRRRA